jgi:hypothetical protein
VGTNGDIILNFDVPKGDTGEQGIQGDTGDTGFGVPEPIGSEGQVVTVSGSSAVWQNPAVESVNTQTGEVVLDTDDVSEAGNLYYTDARVEAVISSSDTDDLAEGLTNLYYTDARADSRAILFAIALGG